jgi:hypothetical protein
MSEQKRFEEMTEPELRDVMNATCRAIAAELPPKALFVVLCFDDPRIAQYAGNAQRSDIIKAMRETANRLERKEDVSRI